MTERTLSELVGKKIKICLKDGDEIIGECFYFTKALDNEPEVASISVKTIDREIMEISQDKIETAVDLFC